MRAKILGAALASVLVLAGCEKKPAETYTPHAGTLALSRDDAFLYAVDADNGIVSVVDTAAHRKVAEVKVGREPARVAVGPDDTIYVSNRGDRSVSVIRRGTWEEAARIPVGVEPTGLAVSPDGKTLYVVNATALDTTEHGTLTAIDTKTLKARWDLPVGQEPRGVALLENGTALVTLFRAGDVVQVDISDDSKPRVVKSRTRPVRGHRAGRRGAVDRRRSQRIRLRPRHHAAHDLRRPRERAAVHGRGRFPRPPGGSQPHRPHCALQRRRRRARPHFGAASGGDLDAGAGTRRARGHHRSDERSGAADAAAVGLRDGGKPGSGRTAALTGVRRSRS